MWTPGCSVTCTVTLLSMSRCCATLKKPPTDFTHPLQFCSFIHLDTLSIYIYSTQRFTKPTKPKIHQRAPIKHLPLLQMAIYDITFSTNVSHQMPSLANCHSLWLYVPFSDICKVSRWQLCGHLRDHYCYTCRLKGKTYCISIPSTQLVHYLIDLMKYIHSETCSHAGTWEWALSVGQQLHQMTYSNENLPKMKQRSCWKNSITAERVLTSHWL